MLLPAQNPQAHPPSRIIVHITTFSLCINTNCARTYIAWLYCEYYIKHADNITAAAAEPLSINAVYSLCVIVTPPCCVYMLRALIVYTCNTLIRYRNYVWARRSLFCIPVSEPIVDDCCTYIRSQSTRQKPASDTLADLFKRVELKTARETSRGCNDDVPTRENTCGKRSVSQGKKKLNLPTKNYLLCV